MFKKVDCPFHLTWKVEFINHWRQLFKNPGERAQMIMEVAVNH